MKNIEWFIWGSWLNQKVCQNLHGHIFEELFVTACQDIYDLLFGLHAYDKKMISKWMQQTLVVEYSYQNILKSILLFLYVSVLTP